LLQQIGSHLHLSLWHGAGSTFPDSADDRGLGLVKAGTQILTAADPLPDDLRDALIKIRAGRVHQLEPSRVSVRQEASAHRGPHIR
jgi:hypothetical protein